MTTAPRAAAASARGGQPPRPATDVASSARRAALLLHALPQPDRAWIVGQLGEQERAVVEILLRELRGLGIPADRALVDEVIAPGRASSPSASPAAAHVAGSPARPDPSSDRLAALAHADPARLAAILRDEPAGLIARLCSIREWPWRHAMLQQLGEKRRRVAELLARASAPQSPVLSPRVRTAASASLDERLVATLLGRLADLRSERSDEGLDAPGRQRSVQAASPWHPSTRWLRWPLAGRRTP